MIEVIALILFLGVVVAMMAAPGSGSREQRPAVVSAQPVDGAVVQTA